MSFKKNHYVVIKNAVDKNITSFLNDYFLLKEKAVRQMLEDKVFTPKIAESTDLIEELVEE